MPRLFAPLALSAAAFTAAWWAGHSFPSSPSVAGPREKAAAADVTASGPALNSAWGFARCEAWLRRAADHSIGSIRQSWESGDFDFRRVPRLAAAWAGQDAAGLWHWLENGGREKLGAFNLTGLVFEAWAKQDMEAAMAVLRRMERSERMVATGGVLSLLDGSDENLKNRLAPFLDELVGPGGSWEMMSPDMAANAATLLKLPAGMGRDSLLQRVTERWMNTDWRAASTWARGLPDPLKSKMMETVLWQSLRLDNLGSTVGGNEVISAADRQERQEPLLKWFLEEAPPELRRKMGGSYIQSLARRDPAAALAWAQENLDGRSLASAVTGVLAQLMPRDPAAARAVVEELPPRPLRQRAAFAVMETGTPTRESVSWLAANADKAFHSDWATVAANWTAADPKAWRQYIQEQGTGRLPSNFVRAGLAELTSKDGPGTLDWALATQSMETAGMALGDWSRQEVTAAAAWLRDHAAADWSPEVSAEVSGHYFRRSPAEAVDWALGLPGGPVRESVTAALRQSLTASVALPAEERARLETRLAGP